MMTEPRLENRGEQPYMAIRAQVTLHDMPTVLPQILGEVFAWLDHQGVPPAGPPFIRYLVIDMATQLDIELGVPVAIALPGADRISAGALPAGRYATLVYTGVQNGIAANAALLDWGARQGIIWQKWATAHGDAWGARIESYLTDPATEPDPAQWATEVAIRLADEPPQ